jgi:hypothetical protein
MELGTRAADHPRRIVVDEKYAVSCRTLSREKFRNAPMQQQDVQALGVRPPGIPKSEFWPLLPPNDLHSNLSLKLASRDICWINRVMNVVTRVPTIPTINSNLRQGNRASGHSTRTILYGLNTAWSAVTL